MKRIYTKLDAQLQPLPPEAPLADVVAIRVQTSELDFICAAAFANKKRGQHPDEAAALINLAGARCRASTIDEELAILDLHRCKPAQDEQYFGGVPDDWVMTSTAVPGFEGFFRVVSFNGGVVSYGHRGIDFFVRPVRVAASPAGQ